MTDAVETNEVPEGIIVPHPILYKFTNDEQSPELDNLLAMFYGGAFSNTLGISKVYNLDTEEEELVLVGLDFLDDNTVDMGSFFPLARLIKAEEVKNYLTPNGKGGWYDPRDPSEAAEVQESLRADAVEELPEADSAGEEVVQH